MNLATHGWIKMRKWFAGGWRDSPKQAWKRTFGVILLLIVICATLATLAPLNSLGADAHHGPKKLPMIKTCTHITFSSDGNPFPLCPGSRGGNCVWWAWEQWHLMGYDLPANWGYPVNWLVNAMHAGLAVGTVPRVGAIAVFPRADGVWAFGPEGHVAFVTAVTNGGMTFNVTYQDYGNPTFVFTGTNYNVSVINQPHYQNGLLRFIYFPYPILAQRFSRLPA